MRLSQAHERGATLRQAISNITIAHREAAKVLHSPGAAPAVSSPGPCYLLLIEPCPRAASGPCFTELRGARLLRTI